MTNSSNLYRISDAEYEAIHHSFIMEDGDPTTPIDEIVPKRDVSGNLLPISQWDFMKTLNQERLQSR